MKKLTILSRAQAVPKKPIFTTLRLCEFGYEKVLMLKFEKSTHFPFPIH